MENINVMNINRYLLFNLCIYIYVLFNICIWNKTVFGMIHKRYFYDT